MIKEQDSFYWQKFKDKTFVIKIGGEVVASKKILENILSDIKSLLSHGIKVVLVHGGGTQADMISKKLGFIPTKIDGRRITTAEDLEVVKMLFGGSLNLEILSVFKKLGVLGIRVSGLDGDLLDVELRKNKGIDYGYVGDITDVNPKILNVLLNCDCTPVVSPIAATKNGTIVNINADSIATELAIKLQAEKLIFFTTANGIMNGKKLFSTVTTSNIAELIKSGVITDGMIVKANNCMKAVQNNVKRVHILNGLSPHSLLKEVVSKEGVGTMILSDSENQIYLNENS
jgi:acetylglutamate kinase